jgi:hypothetical protein
LGIAVAITRLASLLQNSGIATKRVTVANKAFSQEIIILVNRVLALTHTLNEYGNGLPAPMREANSKVVRMVLR